MTSERVPWQKRAEAKRRLGQHLLDGAKQIVKKEHPEWPDDWIDLSARWFLYEFGRHQFEKSKAGLRT